MKEKTKELNEVEKKTREELASYGMASIIFGIAAVIMSLMIYKLPNGILWLVHPCIATAIILGCMDMNDKAKLFGIEGIILGMFAILINSRAYMIALIAIFIVAKDYIIETITSLLLIGATIKIVEKIIKKIQKQYARIAIIAGSVFGVWMILYFVVFRMLK